MTLEQIIPFNVTLSDIVAVFAFLLSVFAVWKTARFNNRQEKMIDSQTKLNELLLAQSQKDDVSLKMADMGATFVKLGSNKTRVKIFNKGKATAKNVRLSVISANSPIIQREIDETFPLKVLETHQSVELNASSHLGSPKKTEVRVVWDDDHQSDREKTIHLTR